MFNIASDVGTVATTTAGIKSVSVNKGTQVSLGKSNISSMKKGSAVTNQLLSDLSELIGCVKEQSRNFPK